MFWGQMSTFRMSWIPNANENRLNIDKWVEGQKKQHCGAIFPVQLWTCSLMFFSGISSCHIPYFLNNTCKNCFKKTVYFDPGDTEVSRAQVLHWPHVIATERPVLHAFTSALAGQHTKTAPKKQHQEYNGLHVFVGNEERTKQSFIWNYLKYKFQSLWFLCSMVFLTYTKKIFFKFDMMSKEIC